MKHICLFCFLCLAPAVAFTQASNSSIYRFLEVTPNARAAAQGGNHVALFGADASLFHLNPAFLAPESSKKVSATFVNYFSDIRMGFANGAYHIQDIGTLGVGLRYVSYGEMDEFTEDGERLGSLRASDLSFTTALSTQLSEKLSAAAGVDLIHSAYHTYSSSAVVASGGMYYIDTSKKFSAGISFRNLGDQLSYYNGTGEDIPFDISIGLSKKPEKFPFQLSLTLRQLNNWNMRIVGETEAPDLLTNIARHAILGGEAQLSDNFKLRMGYNYFVSEQIKSDAAIDLSGVSLGIGLNIKGLKIDLSRSSYSDIGGIVQISIGSQLR